MPRTQRPVSQPHRRALPIPSKVFPAGFVCRWAHRDTGAWRGKLRRQPGLWHRLGTRAPGRSELGRVALAKQELAGRLAWVPWDVAQGWSREPPGGSQHSALVFGGGGKHNVAGLSWENLEFKVHLCPARLQRTEGAFTQTWQGSGGDLRGPVWYLHLL